MLLYTGARRREVTQMRRAELDIEAATWTLPAERRKTGKKDPEPFVIHLHPSAVATLQRQPVLEGSPYVFWGRRDNKPFEFHYALMKRLESLQINDWRLHDLRAVHAHRTRATWGLTDRRRNVPRPCRERRAGRRLRPAHVHRKRRKPHGRSGAISSNSYWPCDEQEATDGI